MNTTIYYFSGTGNSLYVAKVIADKLNGTLISIPSVINSHELAINTDKLVIVFPSYMAQLDGVPPIVQRFVKKLENIESKQIITICTCGGYEIVNAVPSLNKLSNIIRSNNGKLFAEYSVRLPMNNLSYDHIPIPINKDTEAIIKKSDKKIERIIKSILNNKKTKYKIVKSIFNFIMTIALYRFIRNAYLVSLKKNSKEPNDTTLHYLELMPLTDKSIYADEKCNGCSTCSDVCPVNNIQIINDRPEWKHHCEMCFACDEWCPKHAIHHWGRPDGIKYHHPTIKLSDMLIRKTI